MTPSDISYLAGLVKRAQHNDDQAFAEIYSLEYNKVYNYTRHYLRDDYLAQDAMQEVFILAMRNIGQLDDPTLFVAWLNRICFNVCYDMAKKFKTTGVQSFGPEEFEVLVDQSPLVEASDFVQDSDPETSYAKKEENSRLVEALNKLPFNEHQVLVMRYFNNMKLEDIADAMGISRSSVKRYIASGQEHLKALMN